MTTTHKTPSGFTGYRTSGANEGLKGENGSSLSNCLLITKGSSSQSGDKWGT